MSEQKSEALVTPRMEIDLEHISGKAGTLVVAPGFGDHPKEHLGEETISHLKTTADGKFILIPQPPDDPEHVLNVSVPSRGCDRFRELRSLLVVMEEEASYPVCSLYGPHLLRGDK